MKRAVRHATDVVVGIALLLVDVLVHRHSTRPRKDH